MPDLNFQLADAIPQRGTLTPHLLFRVQVTELTRASVHTVVLRCQVHVEPARRCYASPEQDRLLDLFGTPDRWGQTLRPLLWAQVNAVVPPFAGETTLDLPVPCSHDFSLAATRYLDALAGGEVPLCFLFSGTVFYEAPGGRLQVSQIPWQKEASFRLPVAVWKELMDLHYPGSVWLRLPRDVFGRLSRQASHRGLPTWEHALEALLSEAEEKADEEVASP